MFGHIKERIKIHRGLDKNRKKKAVRFLLKIGGESKKKTTHFFNYAQFPSLIRRG